MQLFTDTQNQLDKLLKGQGKPAITRQFSARNMFVESLQKSSQAQLVNSGTLNIPDINIYEYEDAKWFLKVDRSQIHQLFGKNNWAFESFTIGDHPDFKNTVQYNQYCSHYCVTMFVDIKGSTQLSTRYSLTEIRQIKDTLLTAVIVIINLFGGHVQRLQGDGVMVQFVRVGQDPKDAVINALNAASLLCFFVESQLAKTFEDNGVKPLRIRVGIDYGKDQQVLWSHYGITGCSELTTTSLHTDLAAKLQQRAASNSILIGDNVRECIDLPDEFYDSVKVKDESGNLIVVDCIFPSQNYKMFNFKWNLYLRSYPFFKRTGNGAELKIEESTSFKLRCEIRQSEQHEWQEYYPNSFAIPKGYDIIYTILQHGHEVILPHTKQVVWEIQNRGQEASKDNKLSIISKDEKLQTRFTTQASYLGHHYLKCKIERTGFSENINLSFPIYVA